MTNNEKSATFIGWKPYEQDFVHGAIWRDEDGIRAPDMSKPENYMRALEALSNYEISRDEGLGCEVAIPDFGHAGYRKEFPTVAEAAVAALAALYDAENGTNER